MMATGNHLLLADDGNAFLVAFLRHVRAAIVIAGAVWARVFKRALTRRGQPHTCHAMRRRNAINRVGLGRYAVPPTRQFANRRGTRPDRRIRRRGSARAADQQSGAV